MNKVLYESKLIGYPKPWKNKVRTFCQNPGGFVAQENYDNDLAVVNGHSFKEKKSENTNLAILVSHNFTEPFNQPIAYAQKVGELTNMLGAGHIMVQRYGDILDGKRTWAKELAQSNVKPTLKDAVAGDITAAMPYRAMTNIIEFIKMLAKHSPGSSLEVLLYAIARHMVVGHESAMGEPAERECHRPHLHRAEVLLRAGLRRSSARRPPRTRPHPFPERHPGR